MYSGSGRGLFDIPRSALSEEVFRIASGSVTASVSPNFGFRVESSLSGSTFTGSLFVTGNIVIPSGSGFFSGSGEGLFNIPLSALNIESLVSSRIASGSVTASVSPNFGFVVVSPNSGSQFTGSLFVSGSGIEISSGSFSGSGARLFDIPKSAISDLDLSKIFSGSYTASISPDYGFQVNTRSTISGSFVVSSSAEIFPTASINNVFNVTNNLAASYVFTGGAVGDNPTLTLVRGVTYTFNLNASGHPFYIKTANVTGPGSTYNTGVTNNGDDVGIITFTPAAGSPNTLYYNCQFHSVMAGQINIVDAILLPNRISSF
jgi:hypothetical protein